MTDLDTAVRCSLYLGNRYESGQDFSARNLANKFIGHFKMAGVLRGNSSTAMISLFPLGELLTLRVGAKVHHMHIP